MNLKLTISLDEQALSALNNLADALRLAGSSVSAPQSSAPLVAEDVNAAAEKAAAEKEEAEAKVAAEKAAAEKAAADAEAKAKAKAEAQAKAKAEAEAKALAEAEKAANSEEPAITPPSEEDVIATFMSFLPKDLSKEERADRYAFAKPLLARFGVRKATELAPEDRALAINLVLRKLDGQEVDPENDGYAPLHDGEEV